MEIDESITKDEQRSLNKYEIDSVKYIVVLYY